MRRLVLRCHQVPSRFDGLRRLFPSARTHTELGGDHFKQPHDIATPSITLLNITTRSQWRPQYVFTPSRGQQKPLSPPLARDIPSSLRDDLLFLQPRDSELTSEFSVLPPQRSTGPTWAPSLVSEVLLRTRSRTSRPATTPPAARSSNSPSSPRPSTSRTTSRS